MELNGKKLKNTMHRATKGKWVKVLACREKKDGELRTAEAEEG